MSSKTTGGKGGKSKTSAETKVLTTRSSKAGLQVGGCRFIPSFACHPHRTVADSRPASSPSVVSIGQYRYKLSIRWMQSGPRPSPPGMATQ
jgi:hypothetical protein